MNPFHVHVEPKFNLYGRLLSLSFVGGHPFAVPNNVSMKGITMMHCITEHACDNTTRVLTPLEQDILEQVKSTGFALMDKVWATNTTH